MTAASTVRSRPSASSTMKGSLPPSSRTLLRTLRPAISPTLAPAALLPVSDTPRTRGFSMMLPIRLPGARTLV